VVFFKPRQVVKWNNAEFTNASCFTSPLMCSTHLTLSGMILLALHSSNNFVQFMFVKIPGESAWGVLFRPPWCSLILWQLKFIELDSLQFWTFDISELAFCMLFLVCA